MDHPFIRAASLVLPNTPAAPLFSLPDIKDRKTQTTKTRLHFLADMGHP
jgi:hypothetical protein